MNRDSNGHGDSTPERPNIVLVTADSVRADHCGFLNPEMDLTPTLDSLAEDGLVFEQAVSPGPRTPSSMPIIWTGEHIGNENMGVYSSKPEKKTRWRERRQRIRRHLERFETIPERLSRHGYTTGGVTTNPWTDTDTGFEQGFNRFEQIDSLPEDDLSTVPRKVLKKFSDLPQLPDADRWLLSWPDIYQRIMDVREELAEPYFLWVFLLDPHQPYFTPEEHRQENRGVEMYYANIKYNYSHTAFERLPGRLEERLKAAYRDSIRSVDAFVAQLLDDLEADDPAFVFHSDHGEAFMEHATRGHRPELYEENIRVPLLACNCGVSDQIPEQVTLRHLHRFLSSIAVNEPSPATVRDSPTVVNTEERERTAMRTEGWKWIDSSEGWNFAWDTPLTELYNLSVDPEESENLYNKHTEATQLTEKLSVATSQPFLERERIAEGAGMVSNGHGV